ncbi:MAG: YdcF family protein [Acidobacteriia bacterium]|nr:YdcF family protein [Terriglobia bacterium]
MRFLFKAGLAICVIALLLLGLRYAGPALVINAPQRSDLIIVLAGDTDDLRYWKGIELLRAGYAPGMLLDARSNAIAYGRTPAQMATEFVSRTAEGLAVKVCPTTGDSTRLELQSAITCFQPGSARTLMIVTSDFHTRRALSVARKCYPRYTWTAAAADNGLLSVPHWWTERTIVKNVFLEWQKLLWWEIVERHQ